MIASLTTFGQETFSPLTFVTSLSTTEILLLTIQFQASQNPIKLSTVNGDHLDRSGGVIVAALDLRIFNDVSDGIQVTKGRHSAILTYLADFDNEIISFCDLAKDRVGRWSTVVEPIQEGVVVHIDEELRATSLSSASVGHGKSSRGIGDALMVLADFIRDVSSSITLDSLAVTSLEGGSRIRSSSSSTWTVGVLGVRASELVHKVGNNTVKMDSIVVTTVGQVDEVATDGHKLGY
jgi:hypothetical protein